MKQALMWLATLLAFNPLAAMALDQLPGPIPAKVIKVLDGDSIKVIAYLWPGLSQRVTVRIHGIDTPEIHGKCKQERAMAQQARQKLQALVRATHRIDLYQVQPDKYNGRILASPKAAGLNLSDEMIKSGLARPYDGGHRGEWCPDSCPVTCPTPPKVSHQTGHQVI